MNFETAITQAGLRPRDVVADGRIRRCTTESKPHHRNGWYVLHQDGHGAWGDWTSGSGAALGTWRDERAAARAADPAVAERMRQARLRERQARVDAMRNARAIWGRAARLKQQHPYIADKGLSALGCDGLRLAGGCLLIPVRLGDNLISLQSITGDGTKKFYPGAPVKGGAYVLQRERAAVTCIVEGLATGLAVYQAVRMASVIVAFDAGNLFPVIDRIRPTGSVVICADHDWKTHQKRGFNPGLDKARNAAELIGCGVAYPEGIEGSDWCDYLNEVGQGAAKKMERIVLSQAKYVVGP